MSCDSACSDLALVAAGVVGGVERLESRVRAGCESIQNVRQGRHLFIRVEDAHKNSTGEQIRGSPSHLGQEREREPLKKDQGQVEKKT